MKIRTYSELIKFKTFEERFEYLKLLDGKIGEETFGWRRLFNQEFYNSREWKSIRRQVILRDNGCDLGVEGFEINDGLDCRKLNGNRIPVKRSCIIHHLKPLTENDILNRTEYLLDPEYLITTTDATHKAIHYGNIDNIIIKPVSREPFDTCPWKANRS